jgi:2-polyprenyl-6-methoxyphenol hydroxylase-like FAD-dependent oxidoreductase
MKILISGASVAGPVLAYWLRRHGFHPTLVERAPGPRKTGGHSVDLFRPALDIIERMGVLEAVQGKSTGTDVMALLSEADPRGVEIDLKRFMAAFSDRHLEIMREDLSEILHATTAGVECSFGDSITELRERSDGVDVTFERGPARSFDLVIGADGLHSNVRRLVFGPEERFTRYAGAYLAVLTLPDYLGLSDRLLFYRTPGRAVGLYSARHLADARAVFLWQSEHPLPVHHRDSAGQKEIVRRTFGDVGWEVPRLLAELERAPAFYFDSISQLCMPSWSRGRFSLVGDAGYCPGPAIGGSTSLAVVGAYVLAGELAAAGGDYARGFRACEARLQDYVLASRNFALHTARQLLPQSHRAIWLQTRALQLLNVLPASWARGVVDLGRRRTRLHDTVVVREYANAAATPESHSRWPLATGRA